VSVGASLAVVLGLFLLGAWVLRRSMPAGAPRLPSEVVEVLGRTPLGTRQQAHLLRVGNKLVLVSLTPGGAETITEVTDPVEVDRLAGLCRATQTNSSSDSFRSVLQQFAKQRAPGGFLGLGRTPVTTTASQQPQAVEEDADV
jgi:flagellar biogenesis protein FliO